MCCSLLFILQTRRHPTQVAVAGTQYLNREFRPVCYACGDRGHYARDCNSVSPSSGISIRGRCYTCGERGHYARDCNSIVTPPRTNIRGRCYTCGEQGHYARDCNRFISPLEAETEEGCDTCGRRGHTSRNCYSCYACGEQGHFARDCVEQQIAWQNLENETDYAYDSPDEVVSQQAAAIYGVINSDSDSENEGMAYGQRNSNQRNHQNGSQERRSEFNRDTTSIPHRIASALERMLHISEDLARYISGNTVENSEHAAAHCPPKTVSDVSSSSSISSKHNVTSDTVKCVICLDTIDDEMEYIPCAHGFHVKCFKGWLSVNNVCPICRTIVLQ